MKVDRLTSAIKMLIGDEDGATMVEYALMLSLIAIVCAAAVRSVGNAVSNSYEVAASKFP